jgi:hypothetical protein
MRLRNLTLLMLVGLPAGAQPLDFLGKFGAPVQPAFDFQMAPGIRDDSLRLTIGFGVLVPVKGPVSFEANSMWRSARLQVDRVDGSLLQGVRYQIFDIPMLGRVRLHERGRSQLFASGGYVLRSIRVMNEVTTARSSTETYWRSGAAVGGGVSIRLGWARLEPEYRYTHIADNLGLRNPHDLLVGLRFGQ